MTKHKRPHAGRLCFGVPVVQRAAEGCMLQWLRSLRGAKAPKEHFWVVLSEPGSFCADVDGIVSGDELASFLRRGYELRSKMSAVKADVVLELAAG